MSSKSLMKMFRDNGMERNDFWNEVLAWHGSVTPFVRRRVLAFVLWSAAIYGFSTYFGVQTGLGVAPYEIIGVVLALLLVLRTNSGYDRWYEGRKLWGGIVNQSRNLGVIGSAYGTVSDEWRAEFLRWTSAFPHLCRHSLRGERDLSDLSELLTPSELEELAEADHAPLYASWRIADMLQSARDREDLDGFTFMKAEEQRGILIDHIGACERILKTPLARVVSIKIRRFLFLYLSVLPLAIVDRSGVVTPLITALVAYTLLSLDQIGIELENPFSRNRLSHLPLQDIGDTIERNVMALETVPEIKERSDHLRRNGSPAPQHAARHHSVG